MKVHGSALKHGVTPEHAVQAGRLVAEMVIHAMPARRQVWDLLP